MSDMGILSRQIAQIRGTGDVGIGVRLDLHEVSPAAVLSQLIAKNEVMTVVKKVADDYYFGADYASAALFYEIASRMQVDDPYLMASWITCLARTGQTDHANDLVEQAILQFPDNWWIHYTKASISFLASDFIEAYGQISSFILKFPQRPEGYGRLAFVLIELRRWREARYFIGIIEDRFRFVLSSFSEAQLLIETCLHFQQKFEEEQPPILQQSTTDVFVINMDRNPDRLRVVAKWYQDIHINCERISAIDGFTIPLFVRSRLPLKQPMEAGVQGCFLSHIKAWERVAASKRAALIIEDDACPVFNFTPLLRERLLPDGADFCFVNERMSPWQSVRGDRMLPEFIDVTSMLDKIPSNQRGVGSDGYFLSPNGAEKLLNYVKIDGILGHIDWQLLAYCLQEQDLEKMKPGIFLDTTRGFIRRRADAHLLKAFSIYPPFVKQRDYGNSTIRVTR